MVAALAASVLRRELTPLEDAALGWVIDHLIAAGGEPTLADVVDLLVTPTSEMADKAQAATPLDLASDVIDLRYGIGKLLDGQLRGMFDGPATERLDWTGRGVVIDLSAVHQDTAALTAVPFLEFPIELRKIVYTTNSPDSAKQQSAGAISRPRNQP